MSTLFLDCTTGVSGDMLLASLAHVLEQAQGLDSGIDFLRSELEKLGLAGFELQQRQRLVSGIACRQVNVVQTGTQPLRNLADLTRMIEQSSLFGLVREQSVAVLETLARAEAKVHSVPVQDVHFHEIGAVDTVVDVVGVAILVQALAPERILSSAVDLGSGFVDIAHGRMPVPPPACAELSRGMAVFASEAGVERATPTGLALLKGMKPTFSTLPPSVVEHVGYGCGTRSNDGHPSFVRAFMINEVDHSKIMVERNEEACDAK